MPTSVRTGECANHSSPKFPLTGSGNFGLVVENLPHKARPYGATGSHTALARSVERKTDCVAFTKSSGLAKKIFGT